MLQYHSSAFQQAQRVVSALMRSCKLGLFVDAPLARLILQQVAYLPTKTVQQWWRS
jgi:hypothetical protein